MDKEDESLFYDPFTGKYFFASFEEVRKKMNELNNIYSGRTIPILTEEGKPCIELEINLDFKL